MKLNIFGLMVALPVGDILSYSRPLERYWIARYACPSPDDVVCDVACGNGFWSKTIAKKCKFLTGIDYNPDLIAWANKKYKKSNREFITCDAENMPLESGRYTRVVSVCALEHFRSDIAALREMRRIIKDGGVLAMSVDSLNIGTISEDFVRRHKKRCFVVNLYDVEILREKLKQSGFEMTDYRYLTTTAFSSHIAQAAGNHRRLFQLLHPFLFPFVVLIDGFFGSNKGGHKLVIRANAV